MSKSADKTEETPQQRATTEMALQKMQDYEKRWKPVQAQLAQEILASGKRGSSARTEAKGRASTDSAVQFGNAREAVDAALTDGGAGVGSSKQKLAQVGLGNDEATSRGLGFTASDQAIDDAYVSGLAALTSLGRGERATATQSMQTAANISGNQAAADAASAAQSRANTAGMVGNAAGFGLSMATAPSAPSSQQGFQMPGSGGGQPTGGSGLKVAGWP